MRNIQERLPWKQCVYWYMSSMREGVVTRCLGPSPVATHLGSRCRQARDGAVTVCSPVEASGPVHHCRLTQEELPLSSVFGQFLRHAVRFSVRRWPVEISTSGERG